MPTGRLVLLVTSPRIAPGLLTAEAWEVLRAGTVLAAVPDHPQAQALAAAGVRVGLARADSADLLEVAAGQDGPVVWLAAPEGDPGVAGTLARAVTDRAASGRPLPEVEVLAGSYDLPGARLLDLVAVMDRLRSPGGCPWDARQTHRSLAAYLLEETYETLEALETGDDDHLREELGDLLLQVVFHARIAEERAEEPWGVDDVAGGIVDKLVRRHPHVFGDAHAPTAEHVEARWDELKAAEKGRASALEGVPAALPALSLAAKLLGRAERAGLQVGLPPAASEDVGDQLLALVARARAAGVDAEQALREATRRWALAARAAELDRAASGGTPGRLRGRGGAGG